MIMIQIQMWKENANQGIQGDKRHVKIHILNN